jgi:hypothetical protein
MFAAGCKRHTELQIKTLSLNVLMDIRVIGQFWDRFRRRGSGQRLSAGYAFGLPGCEANAAAANLVY